MICLKNLFQTKLLANLFTLLRQPCVLRNQIDQAQFLRNQFSQILFQAFFKQCFENLGFSTSLKQNLGKMIHYMIIRNFTSQGVGGWAPLKKEETKNTRRILSPTLFCSSSRFALLENNQLKLETHPTANRRNRRCPCDSSNLRTYPQS